MDTWETIIDKAAAMCSSQNELARRIGMTSSNLSSVKKGRQVMPAAQIRALAEILGTDPADLWRIQNERKNPFLKTAAAVAACLISGVALSVSLPSEVRASTLVQQACQEGTGCILCQIDWAVFLATAPADRTE